MSRRGADYLERLVFTNAHRVTNALIEQALESRRRLEADLGRQLHEVVRCAERALAEARAQQARGHAAVEAELAPPRIIARRGGHADTARWSVKGVLWVGLGGFVGAIARYLLATWIAGRAGTAFPLGTLVINLSGSFVLGLLLGVLENHVTPPALRLALATGFLGAYTTFSTFTYETIRLVEEGDYAAGGAQRRREPRARARRRVRRARVSGEPCNVRPTAEGGIVMRGKRMTVFLDETDHWRHRPLYLAILERLKAAGCAGATAVRGIAGFGPHSHIIKTARLVDVIWTCRW